MAATTTAPYLYSVKVRKVVDPDLSYRLTRTWRARNLATGEPVELTVTTTLATSDELTKSNWDALYTLDYGQWTDYTDDTTHNTTPFADYDP